jgi:hypothetical protein
MTDLAWINLGAVAVFGVLAAQCYSSFRQTRSTLTREMLPMFITQAGGAVTFGIVMGFDGFITVLYYVTVAAVFGPSIFHIVQLPKHGQGPEPTVGPSQ